MFPSDLNYLSEETAPVSTGEDEETVNAKPPLFRHKLCCLRQELVESFCDHKYVDFVKHAALQLQKMSSNDQASDLDKAKQLVKELTSADASNAAAESAADAAADEEKKNVQIIEDACKHVKSWKTNEFDIRFNPNMYQPHVRLSGDDEFAARDAELLREASDFLLTVQIPQFVKDLLEHTMFICEGSTLSDMMHTRGINIRYLGRVLKEVVAAGVATPASATSAEHMQGIVLNELVARASKRVFRQYIQNVASLNLSSAIAHYLNCYLSNYVKTATSPTGTGTANTVVSPVQSTAVGAQQQASSTAAPDAKKKKKNQKSKGNKVSSLQDQMNSNEWSSLTPRSLWAQIKEEALAQFNYEIKQ
jgi:protein TIF31